MFLDWKNQYHENDYTIQSALHIQYNVYQITNGILHRTRTNNCTLCMQAQWTPNSQSKLAGEKRKLEESGSLTSDYTTRL